MQDDGRGELVLITGPMFAGKSAALIAQARAHGPTALVLKPAFDTRDGSAVIASRDRTRADALPVSAWPEEQARTHPVLVIDEAQFMVSPHYAGDLVADVGRAVARGARITVGALDTDYLRRPFDLVTRLAAVADRHVVLHARCHTCDAPAMWTAKKNETGHRLELGDDDLYEARCHAHWTEPGKSPAG
jgi:thymidine kinase